MSAFLCGRSFLLFLFVRLFVCLFCFLCSFYLCQEGIATREKLDHCETRESYYYPKSFIKTPHRRTRDTEPTDRILLWAVQSQCQRRSISTELSQDRHRGWPSHPSQRSRGCSTLTGQRGVGWNRQHPSRTGGEEVVIALTTICKKILQTGKLPNLWTQSLVIILPKKCNITQAKSCWRSCWAY